MAGELTPLRLDHGERSDAPREDVTTDSVRQPTAKPLSATRRVRVFVTNSRRRKGRGLPGHTLEETVKRFAEGLRRDYPDASVSTACSLLRQHMPPVASGDLGHKSKHAGGRPRVDVQPAQVKVLRDQEGKSWREVGRTLRISAATAMKLYRAAPRVGKPFENSRPEVER